MHSNIIILDRDGVINQNLTYYVTKPEEFNFQPGSLEGIVNLHRLGWKVIIATNQAGIDRQLLSHVKLAEIHCSMLMQIRQAGGDIDRIIYADSYEDTHPWRKPNPGMLIDTLARYNISHPQNVPFVGDSLIDIEAAISAGCSPVLVRTGKGSATEVHLNSSLNNIINDRIMVFDDLLEYSQFLTKKYT